MCTGSCFICHVLFIYQMLKSVCGRSQLCKEQGPYSQRILKLKVAPCHVSQFLRFHDFSSNFTWV